MDNEFTFELKNLEFHLKEKSQQYDKCISKAVKIFLETNQDFDVLSKPCNTINNDLKELMKKYEEYEGRRKKDVV